MSGQKTQKTPRAKPEGIHTIWLGSPFDKPEPIAGKRYTPDCFRAPARSARDEGRNRLALLAAVNPFSDSAVSADVANAMRLMASEIANNLGAVAFQPLAVEMQAQMTAIEARLEAKMESRLEARFAELAQQVTTMSGPPKRIVSPQLQWLRQNRDDLISKYPDEWIAVSDDGLLGHDKSLTALYDIMAEKGHTDATYVQVNEPLSPR